MPDIFVLCCQDCEIKETVTVEHMTKLYEAMNRLGWALSPTQHGAEVLGVCPKCSKRAMPLKTGDS